jgi:hypothetical protein
VLTNTDGSLNKISVGCTIYMVNEMGDFNLDGVPSVPDNDGWTSYDLTARVDGIWHVDVFNADLLDIIPDNQAAWCGQVFLSCGPGDPAEGYGNGYNEFLDWVGNVAVAGAPTALTVSCVLNYDNEPGYDYLYLEYETTAGWQTAATWNGTNYNPVSGLFEPVSATVNINYAMNEYVGPGGNQVHLRFLGASDGAWSDADCLWPTSGLAQIDNVSVSGDNGISATLDDFETDLGNWYLDFPIGVGNFFKVWPRLGSLDPCTVNDTPQAAFLDDGVVEDCNGEQVLGTVGVAGHDYSVLGGWAVNLTGGCATEDDLLHNEIWSPEIAWPVADPGCGDYVGALYSFLVYRDLPLNNGMFYTWGVNSKSGGIWGGWADRNYVYYGDDGLYLRVNNDVTDLVVQNPESIRLSLGAYELGGIWGYVGTDFTPAPYFDNVEFKVFPSSGPQITTRELEVFQDNFPTSGSIVGDPAALDIRLDMANDIIGDAFPQIVPGDSATFTITSVRPGAELVPGSLQLHYALRPNPGLPSLGRGTAIITGSVPGNQIFNDSGAAIPDRFWFDMPDEDFFYPGDVIHYYIEAQDQITGDPAQTGTLPGNIDYFLVFDAELPVPDPDALPDPVENPSTFYQPDALYASTYTVHGLPTLREIDDDWTNGYTQPSILFWNDFANRGGENEWYFALAQLGFHRHDEYDIYYTNAPSSGVSNGLGSRAAPSQLAGYATMLYHSGDLASYTMAANDIEADKSGDILCVDTWLLQGDKNLFISGDDFVYDLQTTIDGSGVAFINDWVGVNYIARSVTPALGGVTAPVVVSNHDAALDLPNDFIAYGACPAIKSFDQVSLQGGTVALADFGTSGIPAVTYRLNSSVNSAVVYSAVDFSNWYTIDDGSGVPSRTHNLSAILTSFGESSSKGIATDAPAAKPFFARNYPNPFNPTTKIEFSVPKAGDVSVRIYNVRGELVRTLVDEHMDAQDLVVREWNGTNDRGAAVASGVYFYETRTNGNVKVNKMALVK